MARKIVVKPLRQSDLSLFNSFLATLPKRNGQKAFNLDQDLVEVLYPDLETAAQAHANNKIPVSLTFFGPGGAPSDSHLRKIKKEARNWRLGGTGVPDPDGQDLRYSGLQPGDLALLEFFGETEPSAVNCLLVSQVDAEDAALHRTLTALLAPTRTRQVNEVELSRVIQTANPPPTHPAHTWADVELAEQVGQGAARARQRMNTRRGNRGMTVEELLAALERARVTGESGESLVDSHFAQGAQDMAGHEWTSRLNAISPFDFRLNMADGSNRFVEVKTTSGSFDSPFHLSMAELAFARSCGVPYDLYRVYGATPARGLLRVARNIKPFLDQIALWLDENRPEGVDVDSVAIEPQCLNFENVVIELGQPEN